MTICHSRCVVCGEPCDDEVCSRDCDYELRIHEILTGDADAESRRIALEGLREEMREDDTAD